MPELSWRDAITQVLRGSPSGMHYADVAKAISELRLRTEFGATPAQTVNATIVTSLKNEGGASPFVRVEPGRYRLRDVVPPPGPDPAPGDTREGEETGLINAFAMYWARASVSWRSGRTPPRILGRQAGGSTPVDFCGQMGVYLLHDRRDVVYVGRTTDRPLGVRLQEHVEDRLNGRWERFSWFGVYPVVETGALNTAPVGTYDLTSLIVTMEALLIEGLEPPQNRRRGDGFKAVEFLQVEDPDIRRAQLKRLVEDLGSKI